MYKPLNFCAWYKIK